MPFQKVKTTNDLVPFHKLSQWLTYSLIEPLMGVGFNVTQVEKLNRLAEYRNGCLFISECSLKDPENLKISHAPDSELVIEKRQ